MTPATRTRPRTRDVLSELEAREQKWSTAVEARRALTRELAAKTGTAEELEGRLRRLYLSDPELFNRPDGDPRWHGPRRDPVETAEGVDFPSPMLTTG